MELVEIPDGDRCSGSAGIDNLVKPDFLASANPGCTLQIQKLLRQRGQALPAAHPIEILDASLGGRPLPR